jgi:hypothetical protein
VPPPTQHPQIAALILDDGVVRRILTNDGLAATIPFLATHAAKYRAKMSTVKTKSGGCGGCSSPTAVVHGGDVEYNAIRYFIVNSGVDNQNKIKQALNVKQLRVYYLDPSGNRARATV